MGHKVSPNALRYGINKEWQSRWCATNNHDLAHYILEDNQIRKFLFKELKTSGVSQVDIERTKTQTLIYIHCVRVGSVLGQNAANLEKLVKALQKVTKNKKNNIKINVVEIKNPDLDAQILANLVAQQIENRLSHRAAQKLAIRRALRAGATGIKTMVSGRLGGADMARTEGYSEGKMPRSTLRMDIDYALAEAKTVSGMIGVKVWVCKNEILAGQKPKEERNFNNTRRNNNQQFRRKEAVTNGNS